MTDRSYKIVVSGTGCALGDYLYNNVSFDSHTFTRYLSVIPGDGGLSPGKLVFTGDIENFSKKPYQHILEEIAGNREPDAFNAGGPSLVSLIHASQLLGKDKFDVRYFGLAGKDETSKRLFDIVRTTPLNIENYRISESNSTPFTHVFSDPYYGKGAGERTFLNNLGAAMDYHPEMLNECFYDSDITCFGGTALMPGIHDNLTKLLIKAKENNCITVVNTVYDFRAEKTSPGKPWPLVSDLGLIDVLIMDCEEALKISGKESIENAALFFSSSNVSSFFITNGVKDIYFYSRGTFFGKTRLAKLPVSAFVISTLDSNPLLRGDTTGCGDNFAGGIIASIGWQLKGQKPGNFDIIDALSWGIASGGFSCFILGGVYLESHSAEKLKKVSEIRNEYLKQIEIIL